MASVVFTIGGSAQPPVNQPPYSVDITVPMDIASLTIQAVATDDQGLTATAIRTIGVSDDPPPTVAITSPIGPRTTRQGEGVGQGSSGSGTGPSVVAGSRITLSADATDNGSVISVVFSINGGQQAPITQPPYSMEITLPVGTAATVTAPVNIQATATDNLGQTATASVTVEVADAPPAISITQPVPGTRVQEGEEIFVSAQVTGRVSSVVFTFDGASQPAMSQGPYNTRQTVAASPLPQAPPSAALPLVLRGTVTVNNAPAADGTLVTTFVEVTRASPLTIEATATGVDGQTAADSVQVEVIQLLAAGEGAVINGKYQVLVVQPQDRYFSGRTILIFLAGRDTGQTGTWAPGEKQVVKMATAS